MEHVGYYNGKIEPLEELMIPALDRAVFFGDGCYDATTFANHRIFAVEEHMDRFYGSCRNLDIPFQMAREELAAELQKVVDACDSPHGFLYWQVSRGTAFRSHSYSKLSLTPNLLIFAEDSELVPLGTPYDLISIEDRRFYMCNSKTLNLIPNVLAYDQVKEAGCRENVFYRREYGRTRVTECAHSNVLIIKDGALIAPPMDNLILPGITMRQLFMFAKENDIPAKQTTFSLDDLCGADEIIISSCGCLCSRGVSMDGEPVGRKDPVTLTKLMDAYADYYEKETGRRPDYAEL